MHKVLLLSDRQYDDLSNHKLVIVPTTKYFDCDVFELVCFETNLRSTTCKLLGDIRGDNLSDLYEKVKEMDCPESIRFIQILLSTASEDPKEKFEPIWGRMFRID